MHRIVDFFGGLSSVIEGMIAGFFTYCVSLVYPIHDFFKVIMVLATLNIFMGWMADTRSWSFRKAFAAFRYLLIYMILLALTMLIGSWMHLEQGGIIDFASWLTWVMVYFYSTNIFRNLYRKFPESRPIGFLYWVLTFKILEKVNYLKEYKEYRKKSTPETTESNDE